MDEHVEASSRELRTARDLRKLALIVGARRDIEDEPHVGGDAERLIAIVDAAQAAPDPVVDDRGVYQRKPKRTRRPRRGIDVVTVAAASIAIVVALSTLGVAGVAIASNDPASDALRALAAEEDGLISAQAGLSSAISRAQESLDNARAQAATARGALLSLEPISDPGAVDDQAAEAVADEVLRADALAALDEYEAGIASLVLPEEPEPYVRDVADEQSLASVGDAISKMSSASDAVDESLALVRKVRSDIDALSSAVATRLNAFAATLVPRAITETNANPVASQSFRDAVVTSAENAARSPITSAEGAAALLAYRDAVLALRADDRRGREEEEQARREAQDDSRRTDRNEENSDSQDPTPNDSNSEPTEPTPVETTPVEPPPVDPPVTDPEG